MAHMGLNEVLTVMGLYGCCNKNTSWVYMVYMVYMGLMGLTCLLYVLKK